ncbi:MAG: S8 family serine peptidase, partial [Xanthobacteraceae bacterium]
LNLSFASGDGVTQTQPGAQPITVGKLLLSGGGANTDSLMDVSNSIRRFAASVGAGGTVSLYDDRNLAIGTVNLIAGVTAGTLTLTDNGTVRQSAAISATNLELLGSGGTYTLTNTSNSVGTLAASVGALSFTDSSALTIGTIGSTTGISATGNVTLTTDSITVSSPISASGQTVTIQPLGTTTTTGLGTGTGALALSQTALSNITAATLVFGSVSSSGAMNVGGAVSVPTTITNLSLLSGGPVSIDSGASLANNNSNGSIALQGGSLSINGGVTVNTGTNATLVLDTIGTATQSAAIAATNLLLNGSGGSYTLTHTSNSVGTLAANTGSVNFNDNGSLTIGSVGGISGVTGSGSITLTASGNLTIDSAGGISGVTTSGPITLTAGGNLTIDSGDSVNSTGNNVVLAATDFINDDGSSAVTAPLGRWVIYSNNPANDTFDGLSSNGYIWGTPYPGSIPPLDDYYVFAVQSAGYIVPPTSSGGATGGTTITFQLGAALAPALTTGALGSLDQSRIFDIPAPTETHFTLNEVLVQVSCDTPQQAIDAVAHEMHLSIVSSKCMDQSHKIVLRMHIDSGHSVADVIRELERFKIIAVAQPNYTYQAQPDTQRPGEASQTQGGNAAQYAVAKLDLAAIHQIATGAGIKIAVIDSQVDVKNPELTSGIAGEFNAVGVTEPPDAHGTEMAGVIAAHDRLTGIAPGAEIYAIHAFSRTGDTPDSSTFSIVNALNWAIGQGVRVINMSFTGPRDPSIDRTLQVAHDKGIVLVAAAGNFGPDSAPLYPGADPNVIAVTATDSNDMIFSGANRGSYIAVAAPGVDIAVPAPDGTYQLTTGTSVAAAEVSGIVALLLQRNPALTPDQVRTILTSTARHPGTEERNDTYGWGLVDLAKAIQAAADVKPAPTQ